MQQPARVDEKILVDASVVMVGGSQMGRMKDEMMEMREGVRVEKMIRMHGEWTDETANKALGELARMEGYPSIIIVGGPSNSTLRHRKGENMCFAPE
jgi:hypothetical protein